MLPSTQKECEVKIKALSFIEFEERYVYTCIYTHTQIYVNNTHKTGFPKAAIFPTLPAPNFYSKTASTPFSTENRNPQSTLTTQPVNRNSLWFDGKLVPKPSLETIFLAETKNFVRNRT
jgi:hypothetical protein